MQYPQQTLILWIQMTVKNCTDVWQSYLALSTSEAIQVLQSGQLHEIVGIHLFSAMTAAMFLRTVYMALTWIDATCNPVTTATGAAV